MQIPSDYLNYAIGALVALAFAKWQGWLRVPFLDGVQAPQQQPPASVVYHAMDASKIPDATQQSYSAMIDIPHKITVTPQQGGK